MGKISDYTRVLAAKLADVFVCDQTDNGTTETKSATVEQIGTAIGTLQNFADLDTSNKSLVDAINEIASYTPVYGNTASGAIATFDTSLALPLQDLQIAINAIQEGTGTPSPQNIRNLVGFTGANITRCGKNLFKYSRATTGIYLDSDGNEQVSTSFGVTEYLPVSSQGIRYRGATNFGTAPCTCYYDNNKEFISSEHHSTAYGNLTIPSNAVYFRMSFRLTDNTTLMIKVGTTPEDYEAYNGTTYAITWQDEAGTVYGGYLRIVNGIVKAVVTDGFKTFTGGADENWALHGVIANCFYINNALDNPYLDNTKYDYAITNMFVQDTYNRITALTNGQFCLGDASGTQRLACKYTGVATTADWKTWLSSNNLTIKYKLATPVEYTLTSIPPIYSIVGTNNIFTDTNGNTSVVYACSLKDYIDSQ